MHFQSSVNNWPVALIKMPDYTLLKAVNDPGLLLDGYNKWKAAGRDVNKLFLCHRYHDFYYPEWEGRDNTKTYEEFKEMWRMNFAKTIDDTYYRDYAPIIKYVEELNEYTDTRMVTDKPLLAPRIRSARSAVWVWNNEYRGKNGIPSNARLVICNSPVGNDIPIEYFQLCRDEDAVMGIRTYTHWQNGQRDPQDFRYHSGRPFYNEADYGIKVDYILGESGPYDGSAPGGWRSSSCMGGDRAKLVQGMSAWWQNMAQTPAYKEGRILGPGAWFTSSRTDDGTWKHFLLWESELVPLAEEAARVWKPGTEPAPPPPSPPPEEPPMNNLNQKIWDDSIVEQATRGVTFNPEHALQNMIFDKPGYWPVTREISKVFDDKTIGYMVGEHKTKAQPRVVLAFKRPWSGPGGVWEIADPEAQQYVIHNIVDDLPKHPTKRYTTRPLTNITALVIHHTVSSCTRSTESIASYHVNDEERQYPGIAYHYMIGCDGKIELTNYHETVSYHSYQNNEYTIGIALKDDFTDHWPTQAALDAARWLVQHLKSEFGGLDVFRHRDLVQTACPGASSPQWIGYVAGN